MLPQQFRSFKIFLHRRFSTEGYLGRHLTIGVLWLVAASWLFASIAESVGAAHTTDTIALADMQLAHWLHSHATPWLTRCMLIVTNLHGTIAIVSYVVLMGIFLIRKKDWYWLATLLATVPGGMLLNVCMKQVFQRARPVFDQPLLTLSTYSFPSGHTAATTLLYGTLAAYLISRLTLWRWRTAIVIVTAAAAMVALVGFSRMYLGVHYLSDVLAATVEGIAWLALCLTVATSWRKHRAGLSITGHASVSRE
ncbi:MAG: phosphatase PAP2 family protein [Glaciimonas sp.]|nr:phosphatase PAP2 family protein [Glaciimonas sp.]